MANLLMISSVDTLHYFLRISATLLAALSVVLALHAIAFRRRGTLPPGPKPLPLIGNVLDIPLSEEWLTWQKYVNRYGDLVYFTALGRNYLLLGSHEAINDLLDKRAHFNDRPHLTMLSELMGVGWGLLLVPYGDHWRRGRKIMHSQTNMKAAEGYRHVQVRNARRFVGDLLASENQRPADRLSDTSKAVLPHMVRYNFAYTTLDMVYGIDVRTSEMEADYVEPAERLLHRFSQGCSPGQFVVDYIPLLKHVPSWVPGAGFQRIAGETSALSEQILEVPIQHMKSHMEADSSRATMAAEMLKAYPHDERLVKEMAATVYLAGSDTTVSAVTSFFLAMVVYPEVQKHAQEELEYVVGCGRFPDFSDKARLPYLEGVIRECLRWLPVAPVAPGHVTTQDDEYRGYFIPKGTVALPFQWGLPHDADTYPEPSLFSPERYLTRLSDGTWSIREDVQDPRKFIFGFGRRVCPGSHIAEQALFAILTTVLQTLDVVRVKDHDGHEVIPEARMSSGLLCHPIPFAYALCVRKDTQSLVDMCNAAAGHH